MQWDRDDDDGIGFGFIDAAQALIQHWQEHGPNDGLLVPIVLSYMDSKFARLNLAQPVVGSTEGVSGL